jgi:hypothetical protein
MNKYRAIKSILHLFCQQSIGEWSSDYDNFVRNLPLPFQDKFVSVRSGNSFLLVNEETQLVRAFDQLAFKLKECDRKKALQQDLKIRELAAICCAYQFGMRPLQIGLVKLKDVRIWARENTNELTVHVTFPMVKQHQSQKIVPLTRKIKREWANVFVELYDLRIKNGASGNDSFFDVDSSSEVSALIKNTLKINFGIERSATDLRHASAQRLVDAGASQEELSAFLGHSDIDTCLIYFETSPSQAERVNKALGISKIYSKVAKIAHDRFIDENELRQLKGEQQIAGVPHGIPIAGIGGCSSGQPLCPSNPIMACYGCYKFMPHQDPQIHNAVLNDMRQVVQSFIDTGRSDDNSPAFLQLRHTINNIESIISELQGEIDE